jgi:apolipoprotein N-acyltransferase
LAWIALAPLLLALLGGGRAVSASRAFLLGLCAGAVYFAGTLYWIVDTVQLHGGLPLPVGIAVAALLVAYLSIYPGLFAVLAAASVGRFGVSGLWLTPWFWVVTEWLRGSVGPGFPWVPLGASQASVLPAIQITSVLGVYGLSGIIALTATAAVVLAVSRQRATRLAVASVFAVTAAMMVWGAWRVSRGDLLAGGGPLRVGLVQGAIAQDQKWDPRFSQDIMNRYLSLSREVIEAGAELVLWPEASTPFPFEANARVATPIRQLASETGTPFIIGSDQIVAATSTVPEQYFNAAVLVERDGQARQWYRKMRLAPFGEYVPLKSLLFFVGPLVEKVSDFTAGTEAVVFDVEGRRISVAICYESIYPELAGQFAANGSSLLATITNDAWFGRTSAPYQHFELGAVRAVEQGRFVVRAANTGISGAVDPYGRVVTTTPLFEAAAVTVDVRLLTERTIYSRVGDVVVWGALAVTAWLLIQIYADRRRPRVIGTRPM